jgi:hypothetical protein
MDQRADARILEQRALRVCLITCRNFAKSYTFLPSTLPLVTVQAWFISDDTPVTFDNVVVPPSFSYLMLASKARFTKASEAPRKLATRSLVKAGVGKMAIPF